ncbi:MAG: hypothetical protein GY853_14710 [PVC group bacterium]|nr:hypothetical protein [PVC group bacterium]
MDDFDNFVEHDFVFGSDSIKCPHCDTVIDSSLFFEDELECPECGKKIKK